MRAPLVSVCMPVSRSSEAIERSLRSALAQSLEDVEILVGDDAGHGLRAVERAADRRVHYERNTPPLGFVANHEALLARARGGLLAFLHDDDCWAPTYLERAVRALDEHPRAGFALTAHRETPGGIVAPHPPAGYYARALPLLLEEDRRLLPSATVMRREILSDVRDPWPELSCGDMVLYLDAASAGWGATVVGETLVTYARHPGQISAENVRFREDLARLFELYDFADPAVERLRRHRVAISRLSLARAQLKAGDVAQARASVARARRAERSRRTLLEAGALSTLGRWPGLLRVTLRAWYAVRGAPPTASIAGSR